MAHDHDHSKQPGNIKLAVFLNLGFTVFEFIVGVYVNSVAIIADALHDTGDSLSLGLSWYLDRKSKKSGNQKYTFGYQRFSLLGALINSVILIAGSCFVIYEARSEEHTSELQSLMRISYAVFCLKKKN